MRWPPRNEDHSELRRLRKEQAELLKRLASQIGKLPEKQEQQRTLPQLDDVRWEPGQKGLFDEDEDDDTTTKGST